MFNFKLTENDVEKIKRCYIRLLGFKIYIFSILCIDVRTRVVLLECDNKLISNAELNCVYVCFINFNGCWRLRFFWFFFFFFGFFSLLSSLRRLYVAFGYTFVLRIWWTMCAHDRGPFLKQTMATAKFVYTLQMFSVTILYDLCIKNKKKRQKLRITHSMRCNYFCFTWN